MHYFKITSQVASNYRGPAQLEGLASILQKDCGLDSGATKYVHSLAHTALLVGWGVARWKKQVTSRNAALWQPLSLVLKWQSNTKSQRGKWDLMTPPSSGESKPCQITAALARLHWLKEHGPSRLLQRACSPKRVKEIKMFSPTTTIQSLKTCPNTHIIMFMTNREKPHQVKN